MSLALELASRGQGYVEPNPMVGCVIVGDDQVIAEGWHQKFGQDHAEIEALDAAGRNVNGSTMYVTLEPCCHRGKTPPCTDAVIASGVRRVVVAEPDPFPEVSGGGLSRLKQAGIETSVGVLEAEAHELNAPYHTLLASNRPWVMAKWAMSLDGKIATTAGNSKWISNEQSRKTAHLLRGRVDAILVGSGTAAADDPLLTARPKGPRLASRIVLDSQANLAVDSRLVESLDEAPVLVVTSPASQADKRQRLIDRGCEVLVLEGSRQERLAELLLELGRRRMSNILVEGGSKVLGTFLEADLLDEVHVYLGAILIGGAGAPSAIAGEGVAAIDIAPRLRSIQHRPIGDNLYLTGRIH